MLFEFHMSELSWFCFCWFACIFIYLHVFVFVVHFSTLVYIALNGVLRVNM